MSVERDEIQLAYDVVNMINNIERMLRSSAENAKSMIAKIDSINITPDKQGKLVSGLTALNLEASKLKSDLTSLKNVALYVLENTKEITEVN